MSDVQKLTLVLMMIVQLDAIFTAMAIYGKYGREANPIMRLVFRLPKTWALFVLEIVQIVPCLVLFKYIGSSTVEIVLLAIALLVRITSMLSGFYAYIRHLETGDETKEVE